MFSHIKKEKSAYFSPLAKTIVLKRRELLLSVLVLSFLLLLLPTMRFDSRRKKKRKREISLGKLAPQVFSPRRFPRRVERIKKCGKILLADKFVQIRALHENCFPLRRTTVSSMCSNVFFLLGMTVVV